ncbi:MAG: hypothetical protein R2764_19535 [Bacteroidales bacterium]
MTVKNVNQLIDDTLEAGMKYLVLPSLVQSRRDTLDGYKISAENLISLAPDAETQA